MNKQRRKDIEALVAELEGLRGRADDLASEEQEYLDNMPEGLRDGERGQTAEGAVDALENGATAIGDAIDYLSNALEG